MTKRLTLKITAGVLAALYLTATAFADHHDEANPNSIVGIDSERFGLDSSEISEIRAQMQAAVDGNFIPGALLMVGNSDGVGFLESVGTQKQGSATPVDEQTIFRIYSMTKPIISVAIMTMVEDGMIKLDDPVSKFIPEFADLQIINR